MTKVRTYRIDVNDDANIGDAIVIAWNGCMIWCHLGTSSSLDTWSCPWNVPILDSHWRLPDSTSPSSVMQKCVYDPNNKWADVYDYCNFDNTPEIPVVNDPTVTFTQGWITVWSISLNQAWNTEIALMAGWVSAGKWIDIDNWEVSVKFDESSIVLNDNSNLSVCDYDTIKAGAAAWATAVQVNDLATVAMSGSYTDLINKPEIPSAQIQSDWEQTNTNLADYIKNKPTIGNATITLQKNGSNVDCFELNQTANKNINLVLSKWDVGLWNVDNTSDADKPVSSAVQCALDLKQDNISDLNTIRNNAYAGKTANDTISWYWDIVSCNASDFATAEQWAKADTAIQATDLSQVATSWQYCDLSWVPSLSTVATSGCYSDLSWTPNLCTVATSWCYCDLSWTPSLCSVATSGKYCDLIWTPTIPTDNCQLANSCWFVTNAVNDLTNYYLKSETYQKCEVDNLIANFWWFEVVSVLPTTNIKTNVIYLKWPIWTGTDRYEEWIYYNNTWTLIWETSTDLSNYAKCCDIPTDNCQLWNSCWYITWISWSDVTAALWYTPYNSTNPNWYTSCTGTVVSSDLAPYAKSCDLCTVATTWSYNDLTDKLTAGNWINITNWEISSNWMTILSYWNSTWSDFETAYNNKMVVYARASSNSNPATWSQNRLAFMAYVNNADNPTEVEFQYYRSVSAHCDALQWDQVFVYKLNKTSWWSVITRNAFSKIVAGPWLSSSYANCCLTLCLDKWVSDLTNYTLSSNLSTVATSGCYNDLSGLPTIPTDNCQLSNGCNYITKDVNNLTNYTPTSSLSVVATSWAYCDLTNIPEFSCVAMSGCYDDLAWKPNLWVYQCVCNMVCSLNWADHNHYPTAKTVADALSCAWAWDMLSSVYDPNNCARDAFNYNNFYNKPNLATVATSWKYCDLSWLPTIPPVLTSWCAISISSNKINVQYDWSTIKKNDWNCLYADFTGLATTASLCPVATSWQYCDLSWLPTIPTNNNQLTNGCWYTTCTWTLVAGDLAPYAKSNTLCTVATSGQYCDLTGIPSLATVATTGCYNDLTGKPTIPTVNTKTFALSSTSDTTNASAAATYINDGNNAIIILNNIAYNLSSKTSTQMVFKWPVSITTNTGDTSISQATLTFTVSWNNVTAISNASTSLGKYLETDRNYSTPLTPQYDWSPATKKYVDDHVWSQWWCITGTLSDQTDLNNALNDKANCSDIPTDNCQLANWCWYLTCASLATVATSGKYCDLSWTPNLCTVATSGKYCDLTDAPSLCTVATSWQYCDLSGLPTIPTDNCQLANWCWYVTSSSLDTRTFTLSNTSDTTNATAALTHINWWGNAIILYNNVVYTLNSKTSSQLVFKWPSTITAWASYTTINQPTLTFTVSWASVTAITSANASLWKYLEVDRNYNTPLTPSYDWSPATKKYVDDHVWSQWWCITGTLSDQTDLNNILNCKAQCCDIPTDNCQLSNSCWYTTCTGTLSATNIWTNWQVLTQTSSWPAWCDAEWWGWDMQYCDFNFVTKTWNSITLDLSSEITPSSNFTVNVPSEIKNWQAYVLRVNNWATAYTMTLGNCINNPNDMNLTLTPNWTDQFVFYAINNNELDLQVWAENEFIYVTQAEYDALPSTKNFDWKTYLIYF